MQKIVLTAILTSLSALSFAQEKAPKKDMVYRRIEIKGNDTIVDITKNYDQLSEAERKQLDSFKDSDILMMAPRRMRVKRLDSATVSKWKDDKTKEVIVLKDGEDFAVPRMQKRISIKGDSTLRKKIIIVNGGDGSEDILMAPGMINEDILIDAMPPAPRKMFIKKRFSPVYELKFSIAAKGTVDVLVKDENGKEAFKETVQNFTGNYTKSIELQPGNYTVIVNQKGKQLLKYSVDR